MRHYVVALSLVLLFSTPAFPEFYKWVDGSGTEHFTDDFSTIPKKYRKKAAPMQGYDDAEISAPIPDTGRGNNSGEATKDIGISPPETTKGKPKRSLEDDSSRTATLARKLLKDGQTEREKAYELFSWIRGNITYDNGTKWQRRYGNSGADQSPEGVLASGRGVCEGMANLFTVVAEKMGLESAVVTGRASGARQERHAWNAVKVDGKWGLVDITRHSFLATPQEFLARHFPDNPRWQLLDSPLTYQEWLKR